MGKCWDGSKVAFKQGFSVFSEFMLDLFTNFTLHS